MIVATNSRTGQSHRFPNTPAFMSWLSHRPHDASVLNVSEIRLVRCEEAAVPLPAAASSERTEPPVDHQSEGLTASSTVGSALHFSEGSN